MGGGKSICARSDRYTHKSAPREGGVGFHRVGRVRALDRADLPPPAPEGMEGAGSHPLGNDGNAALCTPQSQAHGLRLPSRYTRGFLSPLACAAKSRWRLRRRLGIGRTGNRHSDARAQLPESVDAEHSVLPSFFLWVAYAVRATSGPAEV